MPINFSKLIVQLYVPSHVRMAPVCLMILAPALKASVETHVLRNVSENMHMCTSYSYML